MKFYNIVKVALVAGLFQASIAQASNTLGIVADIEPQKQREISFTVNTFHATKMLKGMTTQSDFIYWLDRKPSEDYHVTLEMLEKKDGSAFQPQDVASVEDMLLNFGRTATRLNSPKNMVSGAKVYRANGYEVRMFVHYEDGTHQQFAIFDPQRPAGEAEVIEDLLTCQKKIGYVNLVLKIGTHYDLFEDWNDQRRQMDANEANGIPCPFKRTYGHELETHITVANLHKFGKKQNEIVGDKVQRKNGKSAWSSPFEGRPDMQLLVDVFYQVHNKTSFAKLDGIVLDSLNITKLEEKKLVMVKQVPLNDPKAQAPVLVNNNNNNNNNNLPAPAAEPRAPAPAPAPEFDHLEYLRANPHLIIEAIRLGKSTPDYAEEHYKKSIGQAPKQSGAFNPDSYLRLNPDLAGHVAKVKMSLEDARAFATKHYNDHGKREGRKF